VFIFLKYLLIDLLIAHASDFRLFANSGDFLLISHTGDLVIPHTDVFLLVDHAGNLNEVTLLLDSDIAIGKLVIDHHSVIIAK
jgi:hypothetical protein